MIGYIYIIRNSINGKFYIGSSENYHIRKLRHFNELRKNKHHSIHLQRAFNKYSEEKLRKAHLGKCNNGQKKPIIINNMEYKSLSEASRQLKIPSSTIYYRINSKNVKFVKYSYK